MKISKEKFNIKNKKGITMINIILIITLVLMLIGVSIYIVYKLTNGKSERNTNELVNENITNEQTNIQDVAVANFKETYYMTIQEAINNVDDNYEGTINILSDTSENIIIPENKKIILELGNNTIDNSEKDKSTITVKGELTINNGNIRGNYISKVATVNIMSKSTLNLSNSIIDRNSSDEYASETVGVHGTLNINSGKIISNNSNTIYTFMDDKPVVNVSGSAEITSVNHPSIYNSSKGKLTITGGTITSVKSDAVNNQTGGIATITGGIITSETGRPIDNLGTLEIGGTVEISSTTRPTIYNQNTGKLTITGGRIKGISGNTIMNQNNGTLEVKGGTITSDSGNAINNSGTLTVSEGANILSNGSESPTIYNQREGKITITGGTISNKSSNYDVYNNSGSVDDKNKIIVKKNWE